MKISVILAQEDIDEAIKEYMKKKGYTITGKVTYDNQPGRCLVDCEQITKNYVKKDSSYQGEKS